MNCLAMWKDGQQHLEGSYETIVGNLLAKAEVAYFPILSDGTLGKEVELKESSEKPKHYVARYDVMSGGELLHSCDITLPVE